MQWSASPSAGFSTAPPDKLVKPLVNDAEYGPEAVNVAAQRRDPHSLLAWFERMLHTVRECEEIGTGDHDVVDLGNDAPEGVLAHQARGETGRILFLHNLGEDEAELDLRFVADSAEEVFGDDSEDGTNRVDLGKVRLGAYGYRWLRLAGLPG
jgi:maltose alpha-D-glucosyltransferase/alpha-amylase